MTLADEDGFARPTGVIFDWDNTLIDSWLTIHDALNATLTAMGHEEWSINETKARVRHSLRDSFPKLFGAGWDEARRLYLASFEAIHLDRLQPLPGAAALLAALHADGHYLALVSNKTGRLLRAEVAALGWAPYFGRVIGAGDAAADKPDRAPVDLALAGSGLAAGPGVWFVGDTGIDVDCALNAGCTPVLLHGEADIRDIRRFADCDALRTAVSRHLSCNAV